MKARSLTAILVSYLTIVVILALSCARQAEAQERDYEVEFVGTNPSGTLVLHLGCDRYDADITVCEFGMYAADGSGYQIQYGPVLTQLIPHEDGEQPPMKESCVVVKYTDPPQPEQHNTFVCLLYENGVNLFDSPRLLLRGADMVLWKVDQ